MKQLDTSSIFRWLDFGRAVESYLDSDLGLTGIAKGVHVHTLLFQPEIRGWKLTFQLAALCVRTTLKLPGTPFPFTGAKSLPGNAFTD